MPKITIGHGYDQSTTKVDAEFSRYSELELNIGNAYDMSSRELKFIEREEANVSHEISRLRELVAKLQTEQSNQQTNQLCQEAIKIADTANRVIEEHKWYSISAKGLVEAAKAVGETASPLFTSAVKVIELLQKASA